MQGRMDGRAVIVTGGARGIGAAVVALFRAEGARVALVDRDKDEIDAALAALGAESLHPFAADIADEAAVRDAVEAATAAMGGVDCVVNNAAARATGPLAEAGDPSWHDVVAVNVLGTMHVVRAALPHLRARPASSIVNVSSVYATIGRGGMGQYDATKAALLSLTRTLAVEEAEHGVRANAVAVGSTWTPWTEARSRATGRSTRASAVAGAPIDRWAQPDEIAYPILWLASHEASFVTGQVLTVDGGVSVV